MILGPLGYGPSTLPLRHSAGWTFNKVPSLCKRKKLNYGNTLYYTKDDVNDASVKNVFKLTMEIMAHAKLISC